MAEMSTFMGYEIVDKKARELIGSGVSSDSDSLKTVHFEAGTHMKIDDYISGTPVIGTVLYGTTKFNDFTSDDTLVNPRVINEGGTTWANSEGNYVSWRYGEFSDLYNSIALPGVTSGFCGIPVSEEYAGYYCNYYGSWGSRSLVNAKCFKDSKGQYWISDEIDVESGVFYQRTNKMVFDGSSDEVITKVRANEDEWLYYISIPSDIEAPYFGEHGDIYFCNRLKSGISGAGNDIDNTCIEAYSDKFIINVGYYMSANTVDEVRKVLAQYPITIYYVIATVICRELLSDSQNEARLDRYKNIRLVNSSPSGDSYLPGITTGSGAAMEFSYATNSTGLALALDIRKSDTGSGGEAMDVLPETNVAGQFLVSNGDGTVSWASLDIAEGGEY